MKDKLKLTKIPSFFLWFGYKQENYFSELTENVSFLDV